jgi:hypothetical protein
MNISKEFIEAVLAEFNRRSEICWKYGIPVTEIMEGAAIPPGWVLDPMLDFYMPPTLLES